MAENCLEVVKDREFSNVDDSVVVDELAQLLKSDLPPKTEIKKSLEPIAVLTIAGGFVLSGIAGGFLGRLGEDAYGLLKQKLSRLFSKRGPEKSERLLRFRFTIHRGSEEVNAEVILTNPDEKMLDSFFRQGLKTVDQTIASMFSSLKGVATVVFEHNRDGLGVKFAIRDDAVPLMVVPKDAALQAGGSLAAREEHGAIEEAHPDSRADSTDTPRGKSGATD